MRLPCFFRAAMLTLFVVCAAPVFPGLMAQSAWQPGAAGIGFGKPSGKQWVQMVSSPRISVKAGTQNISLSFVIQNGLHINSHSPHSPFLIPTTLTVNGNDGVHVAKIEYPPGVDYHFQFSPKDALSVYTGQFSVLIPLRAPPGHYTLHGQLHYQACDNRACNPPKTLPVTLQLTAR